MKGDRGRRQRLLATLGCQLHYSLALTPALRQPKLMTCHIIPEMAAGCTEAGSEWLPTISGTSFVAFV
eukprot:scaffold46738_cov19-Tisochrysis_lutea.AAC.1